VLLVAVPVAGLRWWQSAHPPVAESKPAAVAIDQRVHVAVLPEAVFPEPLITPQPEPALAPEPTLFDVEYPPLPVLDLNPLMDLFLDGSAPEGLLASATPQPAQNRLVLQVTEAWINLVPSARTSISEDWQRRSLDLGYSSLQLVDGEEKLLARSARIGSGMIVFDSNPVE
jgi:hypothetical protein